MVFDRLLKRKNSIESDDPEKRIMALDEIENESVLEKVALDDGDADVRKKAISKLSNHYTLLKAFRSDSDFDNRLEALCGMTNLDFLREIYESRCYSNDANERKMSKVALNRHFNLSKGNDTRQRPMDLNDLVDIIHEKMEGIDPDDGKSRIEISLDANIIVGPDDEIDYIALTTKDVSGYHRRNVQVASTVFIKGNGHFVIGIPDKSEPSFNDRTYPFFEIYRDCSVKINNLHFKDAPHGVFKVRYANLEVYNSFFSGNRGCGDLIKANNARFKAYNCCFKSNYVSYGVITAEKESNIEISDCEFVGNVSRGGVAAINVNDDSNLKLSESTFKKNSFDRILQRHEDRFIISCRNSDASIMHSTFGASDGAYSIFFRASGSQNSLNVTDSRFSRDADDEIFNYYGLENFHEGNCKYGLGDDL